jgi:L-alanine-DL-glutamate epimerase-like enolase superfamily enzyme
MRISEIHLYQHDLPVKGQPYSYSTAALTILDTTIVEVVTDTGLVGYGEICPLGTTYQPQHALGARAALQELAPCLIGLDPLKIERARDAMDATLMGHNYAKAALDIALWDIAGKTSGMRLCDLLGGAAVERVPSFYAVSIASPEETADMARAKQEEGYIRLQIKVGGRSLEEDIAVAHKVVEALQPGMSLTFDANRAWTTADTQLFSLACHDLSLVIEQPCATYEEVAAIRPRIAHPIYLDEVTEDLGIVMRAISEGVADGFGMKTTRVGGVSVMRTVRDLCHATNRPLSCDDTWGGDIIAAACLHLAATIRPRLSMGLWIAGPHIEGHYDPENGIAVEEGWLTVPKGPGLGITPEAGIFGKPVLSLG